jgi:imidazolonepropionase-like amidohydrolase
MTMDSGGSIGLEIGKLIVGDGEVLEGAFVGVDDGVISEVSGDGFEASYDKVFDLGDRFVMPGLIDAHVHIKYTGIPDPVEYSDEYLAVRGVELARRALMAGCTSLVDAGAVRNVAFAARNTINNGVALGPRLFVSGEMITMTGGRSRVPRARLEVNGPHEARRATRGLLMYHNADFIKLGATGSISSLHTGPTHPQLTVEEMAACIEEAHNCGKKVHAHCYGEKGISNAIEAGTDVIVHGQSLTDEHISTMLEKGMMLMPTLKTYWSHYEKMQETGIPERTVTSGIWDLTEPNFRRALEAGIPFSMGTDSGMTDNFFGDNPRDLEYMVRWGATPMQAIVAGTLNAARSVAVDDRLGTIEAGKLADLLVLEDDPTEDVTIIKTSLDRVMLNGLFVR